MFVTACPTRTCCLWDLPEVHMTSQAGCIRHVDVTIKQNLQQLIINWLSFNTERCSIALLSVCANRFIKLHVIWLIFLVCYYGRIKWRIIYILTLAFFSHVVHILIVKQSPNDCIIDTGSSQRSSVVVGSCRYSIDMILANCLGDSLPVTVYTASTCFSPTSAI